MERRKFLASSLGASALAITGPAGAAEAAQGSTSSGAKSREFYHLRRYHINAGPQRSMVVRPARVRSTL